MNRAGSMIAHARENSASLPYADLPDSNIAMLEQALRIAWREACADTHHGVDLLACDEEDVSEVLIEVLGTLASDTKRKPLKNFSEFFHVGIPESAIATKTTPLMPSRVTGEPATRPPNKRKRKRPDYAFWPTSLPAGYNQLWYAIFIEAKVLDRTRTVRKYSREGLSRFTSGQYAWSMCQGIMLGYLRHSDMRLPLALHGHLDRRRDEFGVLDMPKAFSLSRAGMQMHETRHNRSASYDDTKALLPPIRVFHLWLQAPD